MPRPRPSPIRCTATHSVGKRVRRAEFTGYMFDQPPHAASYVELWFARPPDEWPPPRGTGRSPKRTFTPTNVDVAKGTFDVEFVLHGEGVATAWVESAHAGDTVWAGPMKGGFTLEDAVPHLVLAGDDTAIPAISTIVDRYSGAVPMTAILEVVDADDERTVGAPGDIDPVWIHRGEDVRRAGTSTLNLLGSMEVPTGTQWWIAGERDAIREIRDVIVERFGAGRADISLNAHWRLNPVDPRTLTT